jgi:hypothetical protein
MSIIILNFLFIIITNNINRIFIAMTCSSVNVLLLSNLFRIIQYQLV